MKRRAPSWERDVADDESRLDDPPEGISQDELDAQTGELLPDRHAMSLIDATIAAPANPAVAADILSDDAVALENGEQDADGDPKG